MEESGFKGFDAMQWYAWSVRRACRPTLSSRLDETQVAVLKLPTGERLAAEAVDRCR